MSDTGRCWVVDYRSGRRFCIEPISERTKRTTDQEWDAGGAQVVAGGSIRREESIITHDNGFVNIVECKNPTDHIDRLLRRG